MGGLIVIFWVSVACLFVIGYLNFMAWIDEKVRTVFTKIKSKLFYTPKHIKKGGCSDD